MNITKVFFAAFFLIIFFIIISFCIDDEVSEVTRVKSTTTDILPYKPIKQFTLINDFHKEANLSQKPTPTSNFLTSIKEMIDLEESLVEDIQTIESIKQAKIHLSYQDHDRFYIQESLSVIVELEKGADLREWEIQEILTFVHSATNIDDPDKIRILGIDGNIIK